jgi:CRP/FNR family transcriptional regulator, cyclic AMP receptor protein
MAAEGHGSDLSFSVGDWQQRWGPHHMGSSRSGLSVIQSSSACPARKGQVSGNSLASSLKVLDVIIPPVAYPKGAVLFTEGQTTSGMFAIRSGKVKLSTSSLEGKVIILKVAEPGELIGLPSTLSGKPYEVTAQVLKPARVNFIPRATFLRFLGANPKAVIQVAQLLTESHYAGHEVIQSLGLSRSAAEKLARFLLGWSANHAGGQDRLRIALTHEEIGQMIGATRETVTRQLINFKKRNLLTVTGATVNIRNRAALQSLAGTIAQQRLGPLYEPTSA